MATITLRDTPTNTLSTGATVKGTPLTVLQVDDNFNNINAALIQPVTINGSAVQLGGSITVTANTTNALTAGTGLTAGGTFNGGVARTFAVDTSAVAMLTGNQTIAGVKTFSSTISGSVSGSAGSVANALTIGDGLTGTSYNGSSAVTIAVGSTVVRTTGDQSIAGAKTFTGTLIFNDHMTIAISDETTAITTGTSKITFRAPFAMELYAVPRASLSTASTSGNPTIDINVGGTSVFGAQKLYIPVNVKTSKDAASQATLTSSPLAVADDAEITIDVDTAGTGAKGLKVTLYFRRTA